MAFLSKAENKKRRVTSQYILQQPGTSNSAEAILGRSNASSFIDFLTPPSLIGGTNGNGGPSYGVIIEDEQGFSELPGQPLGSLPPSTNPPPTTKPTPIDQSNDWMNIEKPPQMEQPENQLELLPPPPPSSEEGNKNQPPIHSDFTLEDAGITPEQEQQQQEEGDNNGGDTENEGLKGDIEVYTRVDPNTGETVHYIKREDGLYYKVKFLEGFSEDSPPLFVSEGMLYVYNPSDKIWEFYTPISATQNPDYGVFHVNSVWVDGVTHYFTFTLPDGQLFNVSGPLGEDGYFHILGSLYKFDVYNNVLYEVGAEEYYYKERENILKSIIATYGKDTTSEFMLHNFAEYYKAWDSLFPGFFPLTETQYESQVNYIKELTWLMYTGGPEAVATFMLEHPEYAIAHSIAFPSTFYDSFILNGWISEYENYQNLSPEEQTQTKQLFDMQFLLDRPDVKAYMNEKVSTPAQQFLEAQKVAASHNFSVEDEVREMFKGYMFLLYTYMDALSIPTSPFVGATEGLDFALFSQFSISSTLNFIFQVGAQAKGITLAPSLPGNALNFAKQTMVSFRDLTLKDPTNNPLTRLIEAIRSTDVIRFMEAYANTVETLVRSVYSFIQSSIGPSFLPESLANMANENLVAGEILDEFIGNELIAYEPPVNEAYFVEDGINYVSEWADSFTSLEDYNMILFDIADTTATLEEGLKAVINKGLTAYGEEMIAELSVIALGVDLLGFAGLLYMAWELGQTSYQWYKEESYQWDIQLLLMNMHIIQNQFEKKKE